LLFGELEKCFILSEQTIKLQITDNSTYLYYNVVVVKDSVFFERLNEAQAIYMFLAWVIKNPAAFKMSHIR